MSRTLFCRWVTMILIVLLAGCNLSTTPTQQEIQAVHEGPFVFLVAPENQIYELNLPRYASGVVVQLYAVAQDPDAGVSRIEFTVDGIPYQEVTASQPQPILNAHVTWTASAPKKYLISVEAFRVDGSSIGRDDRPIEVVTSPVQQLPIGRGVSADATAIPTPTLSPQ